VALTLEPIYRASVLLSPAEPASGGTSTISRFADQFAPLASLLGGEVTGGFAGKDVWIATLQSRRVTESFIRERDLLPILLPKLWDATLGRWKDDSFTPESIVDDAVRRFDDEIRAVAEDRRTGLITLSIEWNDPVLAAEWATSLVDRTNEFLRERAIDEAKRSISFLEGELNKTSVVERQQIIYRLMESKTSEIMMANARDQYAFVVVDPAVAPDVDDFIFPRRVVIVGIGLIMGFAIGLGYAALRWIRQPPSHRNARVRNA
jgi:hypothetical protein